jgi:ADP-heptose:LPS heptosyltransferase
MGDCLLLTSPVRALKEEFPGFRVSVLVERRFADCFHGNPDFDEVLTVTSKVQTTFSLLRRRFDAILNLHGGPTSLLYTRIPRGRRVGAEHYPHTRLYDELVPRPNPDAHTVETTLALFQSLGLRAGEAPQLRYESHPTEAARIKKNIQGRQYVVIHPGALLATKRWPAERFAEVAGVLNKQRLTVVLTCGPGEENMVGNVAKDILNANIMLGLSIPALAELIRGARLFIGSDSGPMHLAAAVGTPTVAVWGSSDSRRWRPWKVDHRVVQNPFECNPCPGYRCLVADSPLCIESVTVEQVTAAAQELLGTK